MTAEIVPIGQIDYKILVTLLEDNVPIDISTASTKQIKIWKPSGQLITGTATFETTGADGKLFYKTVAGNLDEEGWYKFRAYVTIGSFQGHSAKGSFKVEAVP